MTTELSFRQVHLDFHTSQHIAGIGSRFDPDEFAATVARARVNSITCFARCHHGYVYYDTKLHPQRRHPHLARNLLAEQIAACHARGIRVPIYTTVMWDQFTAKAHPEWLVVDEKGCVRGTPPYEAGFYQQLCLNSPYVDFLKAHVHEILTTLPTDGLFFDIVFSTECSCVRCRSSMLQQGLDPSVAADRRRHGAAVLDRFRHEMTAFVRQFNSDCTIFYNAGHVGPRLRSTADAFTHWELESLPSGGWGYLHFPASVRYARTLKAECLGMTGKFHTTWGDFQSYKNPAALEFECFHMLAQGAKCSVGDQLHPTGKLCPTTYDLIEGVYAQVEKKEPWCRAARPLADIGVLTAEEFATGDGHSQVPVSSLGATRVLQELAAQFDIIDSAAEFGRYKLLVLPDEIPVNLELAAKIEAFVAGGGAVLASCRSGLDPAGGAFALSCLGVTLKGPAPFSPDFLAPGSTLAATLPAAEYVMYERGMEVATADGAEVLAGVNVPYFNRTWQHFCSHRHTPSSGRYGYPGMVRHGRAVYLAHPVFTQYHRNAPRWCKLLVRSALDLLLPEPLVRLEAPSATIATVTEQAAHGRWVVHLLHYVPERRGTDFDVIEDVLPVLDVKVSVRVPQTVQAVMRVPEGEPLPFTRSAGRVEFVLRRLLGHQMIELRYI